MITILIEGMTENSGGLETYIMSIFRNLDRNRFRFCFIAYDDPIAYEEELRAAGARIFRVTKRSENALAYVRELDHIFRNDPIDVFWAHKTTLSQTEALRLAKWHHVPLRIVHSHSSQNMGGRFTAVMHSLHKLTAYREANMHFACSEVAAKWFYGDKKARIMRNAIPLEKYRFDQNVRNAVRQEWNASENTVVVGHIGAFNHAKNHEKLLDIFKSFHDANTDSILVLCGDGALRPSIEQKIHDLHLEDDVRMLGMIDNIHEVLQGFDVYVMPSRFEGLPFSIIEALTSGLNCVVSDTISQEADIIGRNRVVGLERDGAVWTAAIEQSVRHDGRQDGYELVRKSGFDLQENIRNIENLIEKCLERQRAGQ